MSDKMGNSDIENIFNHALDISDPVERQAYLDQACAGNVEHRAEIEALLRHDAAAGSFLDQPPDLNAAVPETAALSGETDEPLPRSIGPYKPLQKLGEGGMGTVYLAEQQEPVRRKVALKIIKPGMDSRQVIARFEAERQALAMMEHPNIARVLDAGTTETGRPFFVMELVKGVAITEYCDGNRLTLGERLKLFVPVCQAIQHAHQKGIIHRDIKPSNVLVCLYDGRPVPKVIDFGVAKAIEQRLTEKTMFTHFGQALGTLEYMSPEQAEMNQLDIDTRSDVYSLGVLLYELLTGSTPITTEQFREAGYLGVLRLIRESEPEKPSTRLGSLRDTLPTLSAQRRSEPGKLSALMRGELDWIVMQALEKDRSRRYETASDFGRDVERYLNDEEVQACPPSSWYTLKKLARRNRTAIGMATTIFSILLAAAVISTTQYYKAYTARRAAEINLGGMKKAADNARRQRDRAITAEKQARVDRDRAVAAEAEAVTALAEKQTALKRSTSLRLAAQSAAMLPDDPGLALLLAVESARSAPERTATQNNVLASALAACRERRTLRAGGEAGADSVTSAEFTRDGAGVLTLATRSERRVHFRGEVRMRFHVDVGLAEVWDADGRLQATVTAPPDQTFEAAEVSADGQWLVGRFANSALIYHGAKNVEEDWKACLYSDRVARVWDLSTGREIHVLRGHADKVSAVSFSADGQRIATGSWDGTIRIWETATGRTVKVLKPQANAIDHVCFSPDGQRLIAVLPGAVKKTEYADGDPEQTRPVHEVDPALDLTRHVADVRDGRTSSRSRKMSLINSIDGPAPANLPILDTGKAAVQMWDGTTFAEIPVTLDFPNNREPTLHQPVFAGNPARMLIPTDSGWVYVVSPDDGRQLARCNTGLDKIRSVAISHDADRLVAIARDGTMVVTDRLSELQDVVDAVTPLRRWEAAEWNAQSACFDASGDHLFVVHRLPPDFQIGDNASDRIAMLDIATGDTVGWLKGHRRHVGSVRLSPRGSRVVTAAADGTARLWQADLQPAGATVLPGFGPVQRAIFDPTGKRVLVTAGSPREHAGWQGFGALFDSETGERLAVLRDEHYSPDSPLVRHGIGPVTFAQFSADGQRVLTASDDRHVRLIDPNISAATLLNQTEDKWPHTKLPYAPVRVWNVKTGRQLFTLEGMSLSVASARFTPDGERIVTLGIRRSKYVDLKTQDGETKVMGSGGGLVNDRKLAQLHVWDGRTGRLLTSMRELQNPHIDLSDDGDSPLAMSPDGKWIALTELNGVIDLEAGKCYTLRGIRTGARPYFSPDGRYLLTIASDTATVHDLRQLKPSRGSAGGEIEIITYAIDGTTSANRMGRAGNRSYEHIQVEGHADTIRSGAFSAGGEWFATTSDDGTVRICGSSTGDLLHILRGHPGPVHQAVFSPDGRFIATRSTDPVIRIFRIDTGAEHLTLRGHRSQADHVIFSADSQSILTSSADGTARLWPIDPLPTAVARQPRELTLDEQTLLFINPTR